MKKVKHPIRIDSEDQIIRQRGRSYQILPGSDLSDFLSSGDEDACLEDIQNATPGQVVSGGGNAFFWTLQSDGGVIIQFQFGSRYRDGELKDPGTLVPKNVLLEVIKKIKSK